MTWPAAARTGHSGSSIRASRRACLTSRFATEDCALTRTTASTKSPAKTRREFLIVEDDFSLTVTGLDDRDVIVELQPVEESVATADDERTT